MRFDSDSGPFGSATRVEREARHEKPARAQVREYLGALASTYGLPAGLVRAVAQTESNFDTGHTRAKRATTSDVFDPENMAYGLMQVRDDQIGQTVPAPDGSAHKIGNDIKTDWRTNARAGVALLAQQYHLATLENPFGSESEHAQQAYAGYSGGTSYRARYLQTLSYSNRPAHPDDRSFLKNFLHARAHGEHQDQNQPDGMHDLLYRYSDALTHPETMPHRQGRQPSFSTQVNSHDPDILLLSQRHEAEPQEKLHGPRSKAEERLANIIYNETAGLRATSDQGSGSATDLHAARVAIGEVAINRGNAGIAGSIARGTLTMKAKESLTGAVPRAVRAYNDSLSAAREAPEGKTNLTKGATQFFLTKPGRWYPSWASGKTPVVAFGGFKNEAGHGDVRRNAMSGVVVLE